MMRDLLVLADDATGTLEAAALLAAWPCEALLDGEPGPAPCLVVSTGTRQAEPGPAAARVLQALRRFPARRVFLKTDSTLRGPIPASLAAVRARIEADALVFAPAYPLMGRTLQNGILHVHGKPLSETEFGAESSVLRLLEAGGLREVKLGRAPEAPAPAGITVCDASSEDDMAHWARAAAALPPSIPLAGPAGFLRQVFPGLAWQAKVCAARILWICGSRHPASRAAADQAAGFGRVLRSPDGETRAPLGALASEAAACIASERPEAVVVFGGDTAAALFHALGIGRLTPMGELLPGIPASRADAGPVFITKAGGFGGPETAAAIAGRLRGD